MKDKVFLDTNIIVYAHDRSSGDKHAVAGSIIDHLWESRKGVISVQILQEFFVCVTQKIGKPLPIKNARAILEYLSNWDVVVNDKYITLKAIDLQERYRFSFWILWLSRLLYKVKPACCSARTFLTAKS